MTERKYQRNPDFIFRKIVNEMVLVPIHLNVADMESIFTLNEVGALIWENLEEPASFDQVTVLLARDYDSDLDTISRDLSAFLQGMQDCGAILEI